MKRLTLALLLAPAQVFAHDGDHGPLSPGRTVEHALSSADHLIVLAAVLCVALTLRPVRRAIVRALRLAR